MPDARDSGSCGRKVVGVHVPPRALLASEAIARLSERSFRERQYRGGRDAKDQCRANVVDENAVTDGVLPLTFPLRAPGVCEPTELLVVGDADGVTFEHDVEAMIPIV